jgi:hypothetical protein
LELRASLVKDLISAFWPFFNSAKDNIMRVKITKIMASEAYRKHGRRLKTQPFFILLAYRGEGATPVSSHFFVLF